MEERRLKAMGKNVQCERTISGLSRRLPHVSPVPRNSASQPATLLAEDPRMRESLRQIVDGFTGDPALQQDMMQESLVCWWKVESEKPGRTRSGYLQSCRFHVQHWLAAGRSLDSHKRAIGGRRVTL